MKKRFPSFLAGAVTALALTALTATALAASGQVSFNFAGVALDGELKIAAGSDITAPNGERVPGSILYVDEAGGKTNYLPIRTVGELLGVEVGYDSATRTVLLGEQIAPEAASPEKRYWHKETEGDLVYYVCETPDTEHTAPADWALTDLPEGWELEFVRGNGGLVYSSGSSQIVFVCSYPKEGTFGWSAGREEALDTCRTVTVNGYEAELYHYDDGEDSSALLVWQNEDGLLFWFAANDVDPDTLVEIASSAAPASDAVPAYEAGWLPEGYSLFETNASAGTVETTWTGHGGNITLTYSTSPLLLPEGTGRTVEFGDVTARFWEAREPHEAEADEPQTVGGVTITTTTVSGPGAADAATLAWTDAETGFYFRLHGTVDQDTLVRVAESLQAK